MRLDKADLHIHTTYSDGTFSPEEIIDEAAYRKIRAIAITDHDTVDGIPDARDAGSRFDVEVIAGVEMTGYVSDGEIHILGYFVDTESELLRTTLDQMRRDRVRRIHEIVGKLQDMDVQVKAEDIFEVAGTGAPGRAHVAEVLHKKGYVPTPGLAFSKYIGNHDPAYVEKNDLSPHHVFSIIRESGGVPVLAHPGVTDLDHLIPGMVKQGLQGIEAYYTVHDDSQAAHYEELAKQFGLEVTGGSDTHGLRARQSPIGAVLVSYANVESLRRRAESNRSSC